MSGSRPSKSLQMPIMVQHHLACEGEQHCAPRMLSAHTYQTSTPCSLCKGWANVAVRASERASSPKLAQEVIVRPQPRMAPGCNHGIAGSGLLACAAHEVAEVGRGQSWLCTGRPLLDWPTCQATMHMHGFPSSPSSPSSSSPLFRLSSFSSSLFWHPYCQLHYPVQRDAHGGWLCLEQ